MVVRLRVGVETQLVVFPREHPQEVGVVAVPGGAKTDGAGATEVPRGSTV